MLTKLPLGPPIAPEGAGRRTDRGAYPRPRCCSRFGLADRAERNPRLDGCGAPSSELEANRRLWVCAVVWADCTSTVSEAREPPCSRIGHLQPAVSQTATMTPREPDSATDFEPCFAAIDSTLGDHELIAADARACIADPCLPAEAAPMPGIDPPEAYCFFSSSSFSLSRKLETGATRESTKADGGGAGSFSDLLAAESSV